MTRSCRITPWQSSFSQSDSVSVESEARLVRAFSYLREMTRYGKLMPPLQLIAAGVLEWDIFG